MTAGTGGRPAPLAAAVVTGVGPGVAVAAGAAPSATATPSTPGRAGHDDLGLAAELTRGRTRGTTQGLGVERRAAAGGLARRPVSDDQASRSRRDRDERHDLVGRAGGLRAASADSRWATARAAARGRRQSGAVLESRPSRGRGRRPGIGRSAVGHGEGGHWVVSFVSGALTWRGRPRTDAGYPCADGDAPRIAR